MQITPVTTYLIPNTKHITVQSRSSNNSYTENDSRSLELPEFIKYDIYEKKSIQQLLFEVEKKKNCLLFYENFDFSIRVLKLKTERELPGCGASLMRNFKSVQAVRNMLNIWSKV